MRRTTSQLIEDRSHQRDLLLGRTVLPNARRETLMFSPSIRSVFTATTFVLAIAASTSLSAARSDNYGSGQGHDRKNRDVANRPITVLPAPPGSGYNDHLIGNLGSIGSNPGGSVVPGNICGDNHAVAARSGSNDGGQGHGKKNPPSRTDPTIIQPASPGSEVGRAHVRTPVTRFLAHAL